MNLKPAPFELLGHLIAATLGDRPADMKGMVRVHLHRSPLADEIKADMDPADVPAVMRPDCISAPSKPFPRPTAVVGHEPPRVALLEAAVSAPVEFPNLDRPGIDPQLWEIFTSDYMRPQRPALRHAYERTCAVAHELGLPIASEGAFRRAVQNAGLVRDGIAAIGPDGARFRFKIKEEPMRPATKRIAAIGPDGARFRFRIKEEPMRPATKRREKIALPPLKDPRSTIEVRPTKAVPRLMADIRREQLTGAISFLKRQGILVSIYDREAQLRRYRVTGKAYSKSHEEVIEIAVARGFEVPA